MSDRCLYCGQEQGGKCYPLGGAWPDGYFGSVATSFWIDERENGQEASRDAALAIARSDLEARVAKAGYSIEDFDVQLHTDGWVSGIVDGSMAYKAMLVASRRKS